MAAVPAIKQLGQHFAPPNLRWQCLRQLTISAQEYHDYQLAFIVVVGGSSEQSSKYLRSVAASSV
jgi:hypothetical protein